MKSRALVAAVTTLAVAAAVLAPRAPAADTQLLLVHGYGNAAAGKDCNGSTWKDALRYFGDAGGRARSSMSTVGYYAGDRRCDVTIGDGQAGNDRPIQDIAQDLANHIADAYTRQGQPVDIIAHSMGGLITRVALLGSAQGWDGFPSKLNVNNVVTLSTPHRGVANAAAHDDRQWSQMRPGSGFIARLHEPGSGLGDGWASGTDWSLVGSREDTTVRSDSGIDKGSAADQKYRYQDDPDDSGEVSHTGVRTLYGKNAYDLTYRHASGDRPPRGTKRGWSPLKTDHDTAEDSTMDPGLIIAIIAILIVAAIAWNEVGRRTGD